MLPFTMPSDLTTERLVLRAPAATDADELFAHYTGDPDIVRYLPWQRHRAVAETMTMIEQGAEASAARHGHLMVIAGRADPDCPIGLLHFGGGGHQISLGFGLVRRQWGKGFGRELVNAAVTWALHQHGIWRVWAYCDVANSASIKVMEQAGLSHEATLRRYAVHPNLSPDPRDCRIYARVRI